MKNIEHSFSPGDEWLYFKIYCGPITADKLLSNELYTLINQLKNDKLISKWFFIRFKDPSNHIRLRFNLDNKDHLGKIVLLVNEALKTKIKEDLVEKITIDTYQREIIRYTEKAVIYCEDLFYMNSELVQSFLNGTKKIDDNKRLIFAIFHIDNFLNHYDNTINTKKTIIENYLNSYLIEFRSNKDLKKQLMLQYRNFSNLIKETIDYKVLGIYPDLSKYLKNKNDSLILGNLKKIKKSIDSQDKKIEVIQSIIHMFVNRVFYFDQRKYELLIYYMLTRHYSYKINTNCSEN